MDFGSHGAHGLPALRHVLVEARAAPENVKSPLVPGYHVMGQALNGRTVEVNRALKVSADHNSGIIADMHVLFYIFIHNSLLDRKAIRKYD